MIWDHMCAGAVEISSAELSHTGRYSCTARNAAGSTHRHVQLTVQGKNTTNEWNILFISTLFSDGLYSQNNWTNLAWVCAVVLYLLSVAWHAVLFVFFFPSPLPSELPVIESHPSALDVILNNPITLPCRATGSPRPTISWQKEGINIPATGKKKSVFTCRWWSNTHSAGTNSLLSIRRSFHSVAERKPADLQSLGARLWDIHMCGSKPCRHSAGKD